jgi:BirA family biotin operon repressor/biotin-[acetyl-CoA-carboxylase] ligase
MPQALPFDLVRVKTAVAETQFASHLHHLDSVESTNSLALSAAQSGARIGVWIADQQLAGRGRGPHIWHSPAGAGLYMTALVAPPIPMQSALSLSLRVAIAVQSAIVSVFGVRRPDQIDIRWPNDLLLNGKKCGGILIDTASSPATATHPATLRYAIVGIGINLNHTTFPADLQAIATSIRRELPDPAQPLAREPLAAAILVALDAEIRALTSNREPRAASACSNLAEFSTWIQGKRVRVEARDPAPASNAQAAGYTGTTAGLDSNGFLLVNGDDGQLHTVLSGGLREP